MKESDVMPRSSEISRLSNTKIREHELKLFIESEFRICELACFCKNVSNDYQAYMGIAYKLGYMGSKKSNLIWIYTRGGKLYAQKIK